MLRPGDRIVSVNGVAYRDPASLDRAANGIKKRNPRASVTRVLPGQLKTRRAVLVSRLVPHASDAAPPEAPSRR